MSHRGTAAGASPMPVKPAHPAMLVALVALVVPLLGVPGSASGEPSSSPEHRTLERCSAGARTLSRAGDVMYPDTGNGGYASVHTDVHLRYDVPGRRFLPGTHVALAERATQCLTSFSLDFERHALGSPEGGPDLRVTGVSVDGQPAKYRFAQPTYPGDPRGPDDPDPRAHQVSQSDPVGGPRHNPLPPACSPSLTSGSRAKRHSQNGKPCPANKLVITPIRPIRSGATFTVRVGYVGRPGVHHDGDGSSEGWFMTAGGTSMTTEPVGTEDWMPLNDFPTAKPTYDFFETTNAGKTVICNGNLVGVVHHHASAQFPDGSATWHWHAPMPIASYLVLSIIGDYSLRSHVAADGIRYWMAQDRHLSKARQAANQAVMRQHSDVTDFEERFNGHFPFASDGVVAAVPGTSGDTEEMESMIVFDHRRVGLRTLYHETMHQWWGDNVSEASYRYTFLKEGLATLGEFLMVARKAERREGPGAFDAALVRQFDRIYARDGAFWTRAPSDPRPFTLFDGPPTYYRPGAAYVALWQILGRHRFVALLHDVQRSYGGRAIGERQLEARFQAALPSGTGACRRRLTDFFTQWFDTRYPRGGADRPSITGPGLAGPGFYTHGCHR